MITIIDCEIGNIGSIHNMLRKVGADPKVGSKPGDLGSATRLILPGVGPFDRGMENLERLGFLPVLGERVLSAGVPILGICLGMQLFTQKSEEGGRPGLGWIEAETVRFRMEEGRESIKIPHMGWNTLRARKNSVLFGDFTEERKFYFLHSYHVVCQNREDELTQTEHGITFTSAIQRDNIFGVQFHPEKSHKFGMNFFRNFIEKT